MSRRRALLSVAAAGGLAVALLPASGAGAYPGFAEFFDRSAGADRFDTAAGLATYPFIALPDDLVLTRGDSPFDALTSAVLEAPAVLTSTDSLPGPTRAAITEVEPGVVTIVGGTSAVSTAVEQEVRRLAPGAQVRRISGLDRYLTAADVARTSGTTTDRAGDRTVFLATGEGFADALSAGPVSCLAEQPVLLTRTAALPDPTRQVLSDLRVDKVVVLGGTGAVSEAVVADLRGEGYEVERLSGATRYDTAAQVQQRGLDEGLLNPISGVVVRGDAFPDALGAGVFGCDLRAQLFLVQPDRVPAATGALVDAQADNLGYATVVGGTKAVQPAVRDEIARRAEGQGAPGDWTGGAELVSATRVDGLPLSGPAYDLGYDQRVRPGDADRLQLVDTAGEVVATASSVEGTDDPEVLRATFPAGSPLGGPTPVRLEDTGGGAGAVDAVPSLVGVAALADQGRTDGPDLLGATLTFTEGDDSRQVVTLTFDEAVQPGQGSAIITRYSSRGQGVQQAGLPGPCTVSGAVARCEQPFVGENGPEPGSDDVRTFGTALSVSRGAWVGTDGEAGSTGAVPLQLRS